MAGTSRHVLGADHIVAQFLQVRIHLRYFQRFAHGIVGREVGDARLPVLLPFPLEPFGNRTEGIGVDGIMGEYGLGGREQEGTGRHAGAAHLIGVEPVLQCKGYGRSTHAVDEYFLGLELLVDRQGFCLPQFVVAPQHFQGHVGWKLVVSPGCQALCLVDVLRVVLESCKGGSRVLGIGARERKGASHINDLGGLRTCWQEQQCHGQSHHKSPYLTCPSHFYYLLLSSVSLAPLTSHIRATPSPSPPLHGRRARA